MTVLRTEDTRKYEYVFSNISRIPANYDRTNILLLFSSSSVGYNRFHNSCINKHTVVGDCRTKCDGERSCYVDYNCTHYQHCFEQDSLHCACALMTCAVGTFWNSAIHNCDAVSNVNCDKGMSSALLLHRLTYDPIPLLKIIDIFTMLCADYCFLSTSIAD